MRRHGPEEYHRAGELFAWAEQRAKFDGETFDPAADGKRLFAQLSAVRGAMLDGEWRTLAELSAAVGAPEASVSARLRDLRKPRFGGYAVDRRRRVAGDGTWEYRVRSGGGAA